MVWPLVLWNSMHMSYGRLICIHCETKQPVHIFRFADELSATDQLITRFSGMAPQLAPNGRSEPDKAGSRRSLILMEVLF